MWKRIVSICLVICICVVLFPINFEFSAHATSNGFSDFMYDSSKMAIKSVQKILDDYCMSSDCTPDSMIFQITAEDIITDELCHSKDFPKDLTSEIYKEIESFKENQFIVKFENNKDVFSPSDFSEKFSKFQMNELNGVQNGFKLVFDDPINPKEFANEIEANFNYKNIEFIQPDYRFHLATSSSIDSESVVSSTQELPNESIVNIDVSKNEYTKEDSDIIVALIDSGVDVTHPELKDHLWSDKTDANGWNFCDNSEVIFDSDDPSFSAHGTHLAGVIAEQATNAKIMVLKTFNQSGGRTSDIISAIDYAEKNGAQIVNCSFESTYYNPALKEVIQNSSMIFVAAAGNGKNDLAVQPQYPACFDLSNVICVASTNQNNSFSFFSNYSSDIVDIAACGDRIYSTLPENRYGIMSGTSVATAVISAKIAAMGDSIIYDNANLADILIDSSEKKTEFNFLINDGVFLPYNASTSYSTHNESTQPLPFSLKPMSYAQALEEYNSIGENIQIEATDTAVIVLKQNGTVWTWGKNVDGICGEMTERYSLLSQIPGLSNVKSISAGSDFCLALCTDGTVWGWGNNIDGQLGDGSTGYSEVPVQAIGLDDVIGISAGDQHSLAVTSSGRVYAWGENSDGQLGNGEDICIEPDRLSLRNIVAVSAGQNHSLALDESGVVWAWGENSDGQLGNSSTSPEIEPIESDMVNAKSITAGDCCSFAISEDEELYGWGENRKGQLGTGDSDSCDSPTLIDFENPEVVYALNSTVILDKNKNIWVCGSNAYGQLGLGTMDTEEETLIQLEDIKEDIVDVAVSQSFIVLLQADGTVLGSGSNTDNVFGFEDLPAIYEPIKMSMWNEYKDIVAGDDITVGIKESGDVYAVGLNNNYIFGSEDQNEYFGIPKKLEISDVSNISLGDVHTLALTKDHQVYAWGDNTDGQLGTDEKNDELTPVRSGSLKNIIQVSAGDSFSLALDDNGDVYSWGTSRDGQCGNGDDSDVTWPEVIADLSDIVSISAGKDHGLAVEDNGRVWAWGDNGYGQIGNDSRTDCIYPERLSDITGVIQVSAGDRHSMALDEDGRVWTWGDNSHGQLGDGTDDRCLYPQKVSGLTNVIEIAAGDSFCLALDEDGDVYAWGGNSYNQVASILDEEIYEPTKIDGLTGITHIVAGTSHCLAIDENKTVYVWGSNLYGELGIPRTAFSNSFIQTRSLIETFSFEQDIYKVSIPATDTISIQLSAVGSSGTNIISPNMPVYNLMSNYPGVNLSQTGLLTVSSSASAGTVQVKAVYEDMECTASLVLQRETLEDGNQISFSSLKGNIEYVSCSMKNADNLRGKIFTIIYDPLVLDVEDLCAFTYQKELSTGAIDGTDIVIEEYAPGTIKFSVSTSIPTNQKWSGIMNIVVFKGISNADTIVKFS